MHVRLFAAAVVSLALTSAGFALTIDGSGAVTDWGFAPSLAAQTNSANVISGNTISTLANDYAPINYPGIGYLPSPGMPAGEVWDQEEMHVRVTNAAQLQVLVVNSTGFSHPYSDYSIHLGDLFLTINGQKYGVVTQSATQGLTAGSIYRIDNASDVELLQNVAASYLGNNTPVANDYGPNDVIRNIAGPWTVDSTISAAQLIGVAAITTATHNYGGDEDNTFFIEYSMDMTLFGLPTTFEASQTWGCGNDVIKVTGDLTDIPEPASIALMGAGVLMIARRRNAA